MIRSVPVAQLAERLSRSRLQSSSLAAKCHERSNLGAPGGNRTHILDFVRIALFSIELPGQGNLKCRRKTESMTECH